MQGVEYTSMALLLDVTADDDDDSNLAMSCGRADGLYHALETISSRIKLGGCCYENFVFAKKKMTRFEYRH